MRTGRWVWLLLALLGAQSLAQVPEKQPSASADVPIEAFREPYAVHPETELMYPYPPGYREEGWVILSFMVDPTGKASEIAVTESTGDEVFEKTAVRAAERTTFTPGLLDGKPIESAYEMRYVFTSPIAPSAASSQFAGAYRSVMAAIHAKDKSAADSAMKRLEIENLYEDSYFGMASYEYARVWGDKVQQLEGLKRATAWQQGRHDLKRDAYVFALSTIFRLEVEMNEYGEAIGTWALMQKSGMDSDTLAKLKPAVQAIERLRTDDREIPVAGQIRNGSWYLKLFKRHFRLEVNRGSISDVKLRCDKQYVYFAFDPNLEYQVNGRYGPCQMQLEGSEGARFTLVEF